MFDPLFATLGPLGTALVVSACLTLVGAAAAGDLIVVRLGGRSRWLAAASKRLTAVSDAVVNRLEHRALHS